MKFFKKLVKPVSVVIAVAAVSLIGSDVFILAGAKDYIKYEMKAPEASISEAEEQGSELIFDKVDEFLKATKKDICGREILKFNNIDLGWDFFEHFCETVDGEFQEISFENCPLKDGVTFAEILDSSNVVKLSIINCGITKSDLKEVLIRINPYCIRDIELAGAPLNVETIDEIQQYFSYLFCWDSFIFRC